MEHKYITDEESYGINYYTNGAPFHGSHKGMRYQLERVPLKIPKGEQVEVKLLATVWPEPLNFEKTEDSLKVRQEFPFDEEGKKQAVQWLNEQYEKDYKK